MEKYLKDAASTRDKILQATLKIIGSEGFQSITIKKIADLAGVNIAAVNYHFGSKSNVINEAMKVLNRKLIKCFELLEQRDIAPRDRLRQFLTAYMESAMEYPDVFRNFIYTAISNCDTNSDYIEFLKRYGIGKIKATLKEIGLNVEDELLAMKMLQMISSLELPILLGTHVKLRLDIDYEIKEVRQRYIELILKSLITE